MSEIYTEKFIMQPNVDDASIKRTYKKRRNRLKQGHCPACIHKLTETRMNSPFFPERKGELISKGGIMKDKTCPRCGMDLMKFSFQDLYDEAKHKAKLIVQSAREEKKKIIKEAKQSVKKTSKKKTKKKVTKKKSSKKPLCKKKNNGTMEMF